MGACSMSCQASETTLLHEVGKDRGTIAAFHTTTSRSSFWLGRHTFLSSLRITEVTTTALSLLPWPYPFPLQTNPCTVISTISRPIFPGDRLRYRFLLQRLLLHSSCFPHTLPHTVASTYLSSTSIHSSSNMLTTVFKKSIHRHPPTQSVDIATLYSHLEARGHRGKAARLSSCMRDACPGEMQGCSDA